MAFMHISKKSTKNTYHKNWKYVGVKPTSSEKKNFEVIKVDVEHEEDNGEALPFIHMKDELWFVGTPANIIRFADQLEDCPLSHDLVVEGCSRIYITQFFTPYKFWFYMEQYNFDLQKMTNSMKTFYADHVDADAYKMIPFHAVAGRCCAIFWCQMWYRGAILSGPGDTDEPDEVHESYTTVTVFLVDFDTVTKVFLKDCRFLPNCFGKLPKIGLRGRMALIEQPKEYVFWKLDPKINGIEVLLNAIGDRSLRAELHSFEKKDNIHHLMLYDDMAIEKYSINEEMAMAGLCQLCNPMKPIFRM